MDHLRQIRTRGGDEIDVVSRWVCGESRLERRLGMQLGLPSETNLREGILDTKKQVHEIAHNCPDLLALNVETDHILLKRWPLFCPSNQTDCFDSKLNIRTHFFFTSAFNRNLLIVWWLCTSNHLSNKGSEIKTLYIKSQWSFKTSARAP